MPAIVKNLANRRGQGRVATSPGTTRLLRFSASAASTASPGTVYDVLADVRTHLEWAGTEAPNKSFRLLTLDGPPGAATVGTVFTSTGASGKDAVRDCFHDRSVVTEATRARVFAFGTDARLERKHGKTWHTHFEHRYELASAGDGTLVSYTCDVVRGSYRPYWLHPMLKPMTRVAVSALIRKHLVNLGRLAERRTG